MCERLNRAESAKPRPMIEGELPDMPAGEVDEDFVEESKSSSKSKGKRRLRKQADIIE